MPVRTAYAGAAVAGEVLTAANVNRLPGGWIGYAQVTASQTGIGSAATDVTGLTVAVTVGASRRIAIRAQAGAQQQTETALAEFNIYEDTTRLTRHPVTIAAGLFDMMSPSVVLTPAAGAHTYKIVAHTAAGTLDILASGDWPAYILVEDLGPDV